LVTPGYFSFGKDELGYFQFGAVEGRIHYKIEKLRKIERLDFSWEGANDDDSTLGRGWAVISGDHLEGRFYFYLGDNSWFKANKIK